MYFRLSASNLGIVALIFSKVQNISFSSIFRGVAKFFTKEHSFLRMWKIYEAEGFLRNCEAFSKSTIS
jgi:hypothetical protein